MLYRPAYVRIVLAALLVAAPILAHALPGQVSNRGGVLRWGQYNNIKYVVAVGSKGENLAETLREYPVSGASCVLLHAQQPGVPVFSKDGSTIDAAQEKRLIEDIRTINTFDVLPIVVLFNSDPSCHLDSPDAYAKAAANLSRLVPEAELWYLPCIVADGTSDQWGDMDVAELVTKTVSDIRKGNKKQPIAAGSSDAGFNESLFDSESGVDVLAAYSDEQGTLASVGRNPTIEILSARGLQREDIEKALQTTIDSPKYGFAIEPYDAGAADRVQILDVLSKVTDAFQKSHFTANPPDAGDTHSLKPGEADEGFKSLFNGKNLNGWVQLTAPGNFKVIDGAIELVGKTGGWLRSWEEYGDFVYRGEYWIEEGGNGGFYIRAPAMGRQSRIGFEFQIMGQPASMEPVRDSTGAIYDVRPPDKNVMKLNDWNEVEITCVGSHITIVWNGVQVHDFHLEDYDFAKRRAHRGYIGLQDHSSQVKYRNLRIKRLDEK